MTTNIKIMVIIIKVIFNAIKRAKTIINNLITLIKVYIYITNYLDLLSLYHIFNIIYKILSAMNNIIKIIIIIYIYYLYHILI